MPRRARSPPTRGAVVTRVVWVTPFAPDHDGAGAHIRQAHLLAALAGRAEVHLVVPGRLADPRLRRAVASVREVDVPEPDAGRHGRARRRLRDLRVATVSRQPRQVDVFRQVRRELLAAAGELGEVDVAVVEFASLAPILPALRAGRKVLTFHYVDSEMSAHEARIAPGARHRWLFQRDVVTARRFEARALAAADLAIAVSDEDGAALAVHGVGSIVVVPNGVDVDRFQPGQLPSQPRLVFTGALHTPANVDGASRFCSEVLPRVRRAVPDVELAVVGARPVPRVLDLEALPGVTVHADVPSVVPFLKAARVGLVPLRIGSGSRLKALEAMAAGRPVVGTTIGLGGIAYVPGTHALVADDPAGLADATVRLLEDEGLATAMARRARALVEERYRWDRIADRFADLVLAPAAPDGAAPSAPGPP